jgi:hypothetical protein
MPSGDSQADLLTMCDRCRKQVCKREGRRKGVPCKRLEKQVGVAPLLVKEGLKAVRGYRKMVRRVQKAVREAARVGALTRMGVRVQKQRATILWRAVPKVSHWGNLDECREAAAQAVSDDEPLPLRLRMAGAPGRTGPAVETFVLGSGDTSSRQPAAATGGGSACSISSLRGSVQPCNVREARASRQVNERPGKRLCLLTSRTRHG